MEGETEKNTGRVEERGSETQDEEKLDRQKGRAETDRKNMREGEEEEGFLHKRYTFLPPAIF